jgi:hypothetical protein
MNVILLHTNHQFVSAIHVAIFRVDGLFKHYLHVVNPLNAELNPICHLLALLGGATIVVVSRLRVNARKMVHMKVLITCHIIIKNSNELDGASSS